MKWLEEADAGRKEEESSESKGIKLELARSGGSELSFTLHAGNGIVGATERFHQCMAVDNVVVGCRNLTQAITDADTRLVRVMDMPSDINTVSLM